MHHINKYSDRHLSADGLQETGLASSQPWQPSAATIHLNKKNSSNQHE